MIDMYGSEEDTLVSESEAKEVDKLEASGAPALS